MNKIFNKSLAKLLITCQRQPVCMAMEPMGWAGIGSTQLMARRWAGHSKWANIKHTKMSKDAEKSKLINRCLTKLKWSLQKTGGPDPKINKEFADVMEMCRKYNIPNTTLDKAIKRALERKFVPMKVELMGPNGCLIVVDAESDNKSQLRHVIKTVLKKYKGFAFVDEGRAMFAFQEKGIVRVKDVDKSGQKIDMEKAEEVAIEADAEEVKIDDDNDEPVLVFVTEPVSCHKAKKYIEESTNLEVIDSGIELIPYTRVELPEEVLETVANAIGELEELEEINRVYDNIS